MVASHEDEGKNNMNKARRTALAKALPLITQAQALLEEARAAVESVRDDEQEVYDNLSEGQQGGDMGDAMQTAISDMDEAIDGIASLKLKEIAEAISRTADAEDDVSPAMMTEEEAEERRMARLPDWAKERIARAEQQAKDADARLVDVFAKPTEDPEEIVIDDYNSPVRGRVVPSNQVAFPALGIRVRYDKQRKALEVQAMSIGTLNILPQASNTICLKVDRF